MLISEKILKPGFLNFDGPKNYYNIPNGLEMTPVSIRNEVINAVKFIIGHEVLLVGYEISEIWKLLFGEDYYKNGKQIPISKQEKLFKLWVTYAKLPYNSIFIENSTGGILARVYNGDIVFTIIYSDGTVQPWHGLIKEEFFKEDKINALITNNLFENYIKTTSSVQRKGTMYDDLMEITTMYSLLLMNTLMYINTKNVSINAYKMSNREAGTLIPKTLRDRFTYHILNIFHKQKIYNSLADIEKYSEEEITSNIRAHMVRGHFKEKGGRLFWWNSFLRCKKNQGFVDKDYVLH